MDIGNPGLLLSGLVIGLIGFAVFIYGKKQADPKCLGIGLAMCVYPYLVTSLLMMWLLTGACVFGLYALSRLK